MVGIDLVDLKDPLFKERSINSMRFISHPSDQTLVHPQIFWLLWTAKEAIYKAQRQLKSFDPKQIAVICLNDDSNYLFSSGTISGQFVISEELIVAICSEAGANFKYDFWIRGGIGVVSNEVRSKAQSHYAEYKGKEVNIGKDKFGIPVIEEDQTPLTFTHHGRYCGYIYLD